MAGSGSKVTINVRLTQARHRAVRVRAVARGLSWDQVIDQALAAWVRVKRSRKGAVGDASHA